MKHQTMLMASRMDGLRTLPTATWIVFLLRNKLISWLFDGLRTENQPLGPARNSERLARARLSVREHGRVVAVEHIRH